MAKYVILDKTWLCAAMRCIGHASEHALIEGGELAYSTSFYPIAFCQWAVHSWKSNDDVTPIAFLRNFEMHGKVRN